MVKTRRSGENGEVVEPDNETLAPIDPESVSDEKDSNNSQRELRSKRYSVSRSIQHWPTQYSRRLRTIKMPRIVFPESESEPEKYSRRSRQVRVFFTGETDPGRIKRSHSTRADSYKDNDDNEDKPIQQNVRRSCRKRKLLHHSFNESWITNELKVRGYPGLYGLSGSSSSEPDDYYPGDQRRGRRRKKLTSKHPPQITDEETQSGRQRRTSARFNNSTLKKDPDSEDENEQTVIEKKPTQQQTENNHDSMANNADESQQMEMEDTSNDVQEQQNRQESESNQGPARSTRNRGRRGQVKKVEVESGSDSESSESESDLVSGQPRRSNRTRKQPAFVEIAPRQTRTRVLACSNRQKPYSLRERKPKILRRKMPRSQSPSGSSSSSTSSDSEADLNVSMKNKTKGRQKTKSTDDKKTDRALRDIQPVEVDGSVRFTSVGGLEDHIKCLREMVLFPLMYPDLFQKFKTRPAKGVLFHGPPGTGKTLLARALANECSVIGGRKVSFFMRKGADCLKKWVGESERHLKLLFQQANKMKPSIIFFDEIDALAPVRSVRQEQVHTSVVGTLLAEMDGLCDRGEVVIIGATNRLDAVDPALRRAGRFDRELFFPPPHTAARRDIVNIYTKDWDPPPTGEMLDSIAQLTIGYGGSDLKALCSEAVLKALRRVYPQVYQSEHALVIDARRVEVTKADMIEAMVGLVAAGARSSPQPSRPLAKHLVPLLSSQLAATVERLNLCYTPQDTSRIGDTAVSPQVLLISGECSTTQLAPALLANLEHCAVKELSMATLHSALAFTPEQALISLFSECRRCDRGCVLLARDVDVLWRSLGAGGASLFLQLWASRAAGDNTLLLATTQATYDDLPHDLQDLFPTYKDCVYTVREPNATEVVEFLKPIITEEPLKLPIIENHEPPPPLPLAPPPPPPKESAEDLNRRKRQEDYKLRELRIFLRDICRKLASNRRFYKFTKPVDLEEVTDYLDIVTKPMDLETMMTKVDMHQYNCAKEFLDDVDLICANALEYNPDRTSSDKQIRHEACSLRDHAHALIDVEMDSDFENECRKIARRRRDEGTKSDADLPDFIYTASNFTLPVDLKRSKSDPKELQTPQNGDKSEGHSAKRKRRRINAWSKGFVAKRAKTTPKTYNRDPTMPITDEESKENKPITSTPLPNGDATTSHDDSLSDDDAPLRRRVRDDSQLIYNLNGGHDAKNALLGSPTKSSERTTPKTSPKKRQSEHETSSGDTEKVLINKTELENILYKNVKALRTIGLGPLIDLHCQLNTIVRNYSKTYDRIKLPGEMQAAVTRYITQLAKK